MDRVRGCALPDQQRRSRRRAYPVLEFLDASERPALRCPAIFSPRRLVSMQKKKPWGDVTSPVQDSASLSMLARNAVVPGLDRRVVRHLDEREHIALSKTLATTFKAPDVSATSLGRDPLRNTMMSVFPCPVRLRWWIRTALSSRSSRGTSCAHAGSRRRFGNTGYATARRSPSRRTGVEPSVVAPLTRFARESA